MDQEGPEVFEGETLDKTDCLDKSYKNFQLAKFWCSEINIGRIELIRNDLESGQRDLSVDDIGFRVWDRILVVWRNFSKSTFSETRFHVRLSVRLYSDRHFKILKHELLSDC